MNLSPEDREIGRENFHAAVADPLVRGALIEETAARKLASGHGLGAQYFGYGPEVERPVRVGIIGTGDEGGVLIGAINPKYVQVVAIADIRPYNVYRAFQGDKSSPGALVARPGLLKIYGWPDEETARRHVKIYADRYEKLLDDTNVEAVIIALPLHLHAEAAIKAMRKGKHVLSEKLMAHSVHECKEVARVAQQTGRLMVVGHQRHYNVLYENAVELIRRGLLGEVHHIRAQWHRDNLPGRDSWQPPLPDERMKRQLDTVTLNLADARQKLTAEEQKLPAAEDAARRKLAKKKLAALEKIEQQMAVIPAATDELRKELAAVAGTTPADDARRAKIAAGIQAKQEKLATLTRERDAQLPLDRQLKSRIDSLRERVDELATQHEVLSHRYEDAQLAVSVKNYGYRDRAERLAGGHEVTALEELIRWRLWNRTGGGLMAELGSHQLDAAGIFISSLRQDGHKVHPLSVTAVGGRHIFAHDRDIDDHVYCSFEYPGPQYDPHKAPEKKIVVTYSSINGNGFGDYGEIVLGTEGTLLLEKEKDALLYREWNTSDYAKVRKNRDRLQLVDGQRGSEQALRGRLGLDEPISRGYTEEIEHWAWSIRNPDKDPRPRCVPVVALADAVIALTTNIAIAEQRRIEFMPEWFDPQSDKTPEDVKPDVNRQQYTV